jgi:DNA repair exonuclease SbcCD ATPase subunit
VLGLSAIETALEKADLRRKDLIGRLTFAEGVLAEREAGLKRVLEQVNEVSPPPDEDEALEIRYIAACKVVDGLQSEIMQMEADFDQAHDQFVRDAEEQKKAKKVKLAQAKTLLAGIQLSNKENGKKFYTQQAGLRDQIQQAKDVIAQAESAHRDIRKLSSELAILKNNKCYVCHQPFTAEVAIDEKQDKINQLAPKVEAEAVARSRLAELQGLLGSLTPPEADPREAKFAGVISALESEISWLGKNITDPNLIKAQGQIDAKKRNLYAAKDDRATALSDLNALRTLVSTKIAARVKAEAIRHDAVRQVDTQREEVANLQLALNAELDFIHLLGREGFLGVIFDEVLAEIAARANNTLGKLTNTSHVSVGFRAETAKGKRTIVPVFYVGEHETTRSSGLSGGMGASADLAVDLGVATVVEGRLGTAPAWFALDESFNGMPKATRESVLEILQELSKDRLILVVDHATELKEFFPIRLTVRNVDGRSEVS